MEVIETLWFANLNGTCGIVLGKEDITEDPVAYISSVEGKDEKADTEYILGFGSKFSRDTALRILHHFSSKKELNTSQGGKMELTKDEERASHDCLLCRLSVWEDNGNFKECISEDNNSKRPIIECPYFERDNTLSQ